MNRHRGERLPSVILLDSGQIISASVPRSPHLIATQLTCLRIGVNQLTVREGAEWRCVDFDLEWSARVGTSAALSG
jgi:hypothetical protein